MRPIIIAINGILTRQTVASWPDMFSAWCERHGVEAKVITKEYFAGPWPLFNVWVRNFLLARAIVAEVQLYCGDAAGDPQIHFISHSNGTDIALKAIRMLARQGISTESFIAVGSVLKPDVQRNGVARLLEEGDLTRAICFCSNTDLALRFGRHTLGYSELGRRGWLVNGTPVNEVERDAKALHVHDSVLNGCCWSRRFDGYGHGTYFDNDHREQTFALFRKDIGC